MSRTHIALTLGVVAWLSLALVGFGIQSRYAATPGPSADPPAAWPTESAIRPSPNGPTILVILHPHCPCSRSTLRQLERSLLHAAAPFACHLLLVAPPGTEPGWEDGPLIRQAQSIPGATVHRDHDGAEARRFGASTSGQTLFYAPSGNLLFSGGITRTRGHDGPNPGARALRDLFRSQPPDARTAPVFGCPLFDAPCPTESDEYCRTP